MQKFFNLLSIMLCCIILTPLVSCGSDDDEPDIAGQEALLEKSVLGKWSIVSTSTDADFDYIEFRGDHTGIVYFGSDSDSNPFNWDIEGNVISIQFVYSGVVYEEMVVTFEIKGDVATVKGTSTSYEMDGESWPISMTLKKIK